MAIPKIDSECGRYFAATFAVAQCRFAFPHGNEPIGTFDHFQARVHVGLRRGLRVVEPSWYTLPLVFHPEQADGLSIATLASALHAEGCLEVDQPGSTRPLPEHPLFTPAARALFPSLPPNFRPEQGDFPQAVDLHRRTLKMPVPHEDGTALDSYVDAFDKVISNRRYLMEE